jgi:hypothetical protein
MRTNDLRKIMLLAWQFFRETGINFSACLKKAWLNFRLVKALRQKVVRFYFQKVDGSIREAFGTLQNAKAPQLSDDDTRVHNSTVQTFFDTVKQEWRCYKLANLISVE